MRFVNIRYAASGLALCFACLPAPLSSSDPATTGGAQTSVPVADTAAAANVTTGAITPAVVPSSMTVSAASAPDLCLTVVAPTAANSALALRTCDSSVEQHFLLSRGTLQSSNGKCVSLMPTTGASGGEVALEACDPNNPNHLVVPNGGILGVATAAANMALQSDRQPATTQSYISFAAYRAKANQQQWILGQTTHDTQQALVAGGTRIAVQEEPQTCLTGALNSISFETCSSSNPAQAFTFTADGLMQVGKQCVLLRAPQPTLVPCDATAVDQHIGISGGILFTGNGLCINRSSTAPTQSASGPCSFDRPPHYVVGVSL